MSNFEIVPVNCIIIGIFPQNSKESSSRNRFKLDLSSLLFPWRWGGKRRNDFCREETSSVEKVGSCQCHHWEKQLPAPPNPSFHSKSTFPPDNTWNKLEFQTIIRTVLAGLSKSIKSVSRLVKCSRSFSITTNFLWRGGFQVGGLWFQIH